VTVYWEAKCKKIWPDPYSRSESCRFPVEDTNFWHNVIVEVARDSSLNVLTLDRREKALA